MRTNLVPLAGAGKRFLDAGYLVPKPLIPVEGVPMVIAAVRTLPPAERHVFVCRQEHLRDYDLRETITSNVPAATIVPVERLTDGQTATCLLTESVVDPASRLTISACDYTLQYNPAAFDQLANRDDVDVIIWTFRNSPLASSRPYMYSWVEVDQHGKARRVSVKTPISDSPQRDHAVVGTFTFRRAGDFFTNARRQIEQNRLLSNEFYVDECMNYVIESGLRVKVFEVDKFICWGTPEELKTYQFWKDYFASHPG